MTWHVQYTTKCLSSNQATDTKDIYPPLKQGKQRTDVHRSSKGYKQNASAAHAMETTSYMLTAQARDTTNTYLPIKQGRQQIYRHIKQCIFLREGNTWMVELAMAAHPPGMVELAKAAHSPGMVELAKADHPPKETMPNITRKSSANSLARW